MTDDHIALAASPSDARPGADAHEDAAFWFARLRSDDCTQLDEERFAKWYRADARHEGEYNEYCALWGAMGELSAEPAIVQLRLHALAQMPQTPRHASWRWPALAASVVVALMAGLVGPTLLAPDPGLQDYTPVMAAPEAASAPTIAAAGTSAIVSEDAARIELATSYSTAIGEHSAFTLPDGSVIELNTNTLVRVNYTQDRRDFDLLRGEAIFRVAKNARRPFVVQTRDNRVTALGTVFAVRRDASQTIVTLLEGKVRVEQLASGTDQTNAPQVTNLVAGQQLQSSRIEGHRVRYADIAAAASWAQGRLYFENRRLGDVVAELNRYTTRRLVLSDPSLAEMRISGQFRTSSADTFAQTLAASFPVKITQDAATGRTVLSPEKRKIVP